MKKIIIVTVLLISAGLLPSCQKEANINPVASTLEQSTVSTKKDLGTAD
jgi:hypothetical protein